MEMKRACSGFLPIPALGLKQVPQDFLSGPIELLEGAVDHGVFSPNAWQDFDPEITKPLYPGRNSFEHRVGFGFLRFGQTLASFQQAIRHSPWSHEIFIGYDPGKRFQSVGGV